MHLNDPLSFRAQIFNLSITFEIAKGTRSCRRASGANIRCSGNIVRGETHLAVYEGDPAMRTNYCLDCAQPFLTQTQEKAAAALQAVHDVLDQLDNVQ